MFNIFVLIVTTAPIMHNHGDRLNHCQILQNVNFRLQSVPLKSIFIVTTRFCLNSLKARDKSQTQTWTWCNSLNERLSLSLSFATCPYLPRTQHSARDSKYLPCKNIKKTTATTNKTKQFKQHQLQQQQCSYRFIGLCELFQYTQLIKEPTRVTSSTKSLIDLFLN